MLLPFRVLLGGQPKCGISHSKTRHLRFGTALEAGAALGAVAFFTSTARCFDVLSDPLMAQVRSPKSREGCEASEACLGVPGIQYSTGDL